MEYVTRRFITDFDRIYTVNKGVIISQSISAFMSGNPDWFDELIYTGNNVGWNVPDCVLMVTDNDEIYRVSREMFLKVLNDTYTESAPINGGKYIKMRYDRIYSDEYLKANLLYKTSETVICGQYIRTHISLSNEGTAHDSLISFQKDTVFMVTDHELNSMPVDYYAAMYGSSWKEELHWSESNVGYIAYSDTVLLIDEWNIRNISFSKAIELMNDSYTIITQSNSGANSFFRVNYDKKTFTDKYLETIPDYKKV